DYYCMAWNSNVWVF
nr:immunoglobulin light chain junction region [Macaca mulatta]